MKCPIDNTDLVMSDRHGIEIDYCPQCRGVWLDRGELDKIIDRSADRSGGGIDYQKQRNSTSDDEQEFYQNGRSRRQEKESWLGDIFDF